MMSGIWPKFLAIFWTSLCDVRNMAKNFGHVPDILIFIEKDVRNSASDVRDSANDIRDSAKDVRMRDNDVRDSAMDVQNSASKYQRCPEDGPKFWPSSEQHAVMSRP